MANKKDTGDQPSAEDKALHERVYEMMELDRSKDLKAARGVADEPIDIFKDHKLEAPVETIQEVTKTPPIEPQSPKAVEPTLQAAPATVKPVDIEDEAIDKVVDEIVISEADALLAAEDATAQLKKFADKPKPKSKFKRLFSK